MGELLLPQLNNDPENRAALIEWMQSNANANENLFPQRLDLDFDDLKKSPPTNPDDNPDKPDVDWNLV
jgi:hypothetical protein